MSGKSIASAFMTRKSALRTPCCSANSVARATCFGDRVMPVTDVPSPKPFARWRDAPPIPHPTSSTVLGVFSAQPAQMAILHEVQLGLDEILHLASQQRAGASRQDVVGVVPEVDVLAPVVLQDLLLRPGVVLPAHGGVVHPGRPGVSRSFLALAYANAAARPAAAAFATAKSSESPYPRAAGAARARRCWRPRRGSRHPPRTRSRPRARRATEARAPPDPKPTSSSPTFRRTSAPSARRPRTRRRTPRGVARRGSRHSRVVRHLELDAERRDASRSRPQGTRERRTSDRSSLTRRDRRRA